MRCCYDMAHCPHVPRWPRRFDGELVKMVFLVILVVAGVIWISFQIGYGFAGIVGCVFGLFSGLRRGRP